MIPEESKTALFSVVRIAFYTACFLLLNAQTGRNDVRGIVGSRKSGTGF